MRLNRNISILILAGVVTAILSAPAPAAWVITTIPNLPGWTGDTEAEDINSSGVVCGNGNYVINTTVTPFRYDGTTVTELPLLPGAAMPIALTTGINADGIVCGYSRNDNDDSRACYWEDATIYTLPYPSDANSNSDLRAYDINDHNVIVGYYWKSGGVQTAFYYKDGVSHSLDSAIRAAGLLGRQIAYGINNNNIICGIADQDPGAVSTAWTFDFLNSNAVTVIGRIGSENCSAVHINESGQTIGRGKEESTDLYWRAVTYDGTWHFVDDTGDYSQWGKGINDHGRMIVHEHLGSNVYDAWYSNAATNGSRVPLNMTGWTSVQVEGINNEDWIVGYGDNPTVSSDAIGFILSPPPGDFDHDGDIDLDDYAEFVACISGPKEGAGFVTPSEACLKAFDVMPTSETYELSEVPSYPGWSGGIEATGVNSNGAVCGNGNYVVNTTITPFRYDWRGVTELDILPDADVPIALATAINADGVVCGFSHEADADARAAYWEDTSITALPYPPDMNTNSDFRAYDINDHGVIVGYYYNTNGHKDVFYYKDGVSYNFDAAFVAAGLTGGRTASYINNRNIICGTAEDAGGDGTPWTYDIDTSVLSVISKYSGKSTSGGDINESGKIQGRGERPNPSTLDRMLYYDGSTWHEVDPTETHTQYLGAINDKGRMVGSTYNSGDRLSWYSDGPGDGSMITLDLPSWQSVTAEDINNNDVIVGYGENASGEDRGFILTPIPGDGDIDLEDFAAFQEAFEGS